MKLRVNIATTLLLPVLSVACSAGDGEHIPTAPMEDLSSSQVQGTPIFRGIENTFIEIAQDEPSFAGFFKNENGALVVATTDATRASIVRDAVADHHLVQGRLQGGLQSAHRPHVSLAAPLIVKYSFLQLKEWRDRSSHLLLGIKGVTFVDLDEGDNSLTVGVEHFGIASTVKALLNDLNVPMDAVHITGTGQIVTDESLLDSVRPLRGGIFIGPSGCTFGFNANIAGGNIWVTNSHCTTDIFGLDGDTVKQHEEFIGTEVWDRSPFIECPTNPDGADVTGNSCRASDATFIERPDGVNFGFGKIARTGCCGAFGPDAIGSIIIDPNNPSFDIVGTTSPVQNDIVDKIGNKTGWTYGYVTRTCVETFHVGPGHLMCQDVASYGSDVGDSGSPVFVWLGGNQVLLAGIHWGRGEGTADFNDSDRFFSTLEGIEFDFNYPWYSFTLDVY